ncbi:MAG: transglutaminase domain-containing protein [Pseudomonadota bacterium]
MGTEINQARVERMIRLKNMMLYGAVTVISFLILIGTGIPLADIGREISSIRDVAQKVTLPSGKVLWGLVAIAARVLPELDDALLNQGQREFRLRCHLCGFRFKGRLTYPMGRDAGALQVVCPSCHLRFDAFGIDENAHYHRPPWFMKGFSPGEIKDPLSAWLFVLQHFRYMKDEDLFGRKEVWQLAKHTFQRRRGDCEDLSILLGDWLKSSGFRARVVLGKLEKEGHAWVLLQSEGKDYILETTGMNRNYRRMPPRADMMPAYFPCIQFDGSDIWFRTSEKWIGDYSNNREWALGPWSASAVKKRG